MSVAKAADMGFESFLGSKGGFLLDTQTNQRIRIERKGNAYVMGLWVKDLFFGGPE